MNMIVGHGVDVVDLKEFSTLLENSAEHFISRCFTDDEHSYAGSGPNRNARLATRFAAKEAVLKALGTGWINGISWKDVEVIREASGAPSVKISGEVARIAQAKGISHFYISLSHTTTLATASVIAVLEVV